MRGAHIDEVCWLLSTLTPTPEQFRLFDKVLEYFDWDYIDLEDMSQEEKDSLWEELQVILEIVK